MYKYFNSTCGKKKGLIFKKKSIDNLFTNLQTSEHLENGRMPYLSTLSTNFKSTCAKSYPHIHSFSVDKINKQKKTYKIIYFLTFLKTYSYNIRAYLDVEVLYNEKNLSTK